MIDQSSTYSAFYVAASAFFYTRRSKKARTIAGLLAAEISDVVETSVNRDFVGELYIYQSHLAVGQRVAIPPILGCQFGEAPVFERLIGDIGLIGVRDASAVVTFHAGFRRVRNDLANIILDRFSPPESIAEWLEFDIQLLTEIEVSGARLINRLNSLADIGTTTANRRSNSCLGQ
jgi:hypothetical protein